MGARRRPPGRFPFPTRSTASGTRTMKQYEPIEIICPDCRGCAHFEEPFEFHLKPDGSDRPSHAWGGWIVVERFPMQFPWIPPSDSNRHHRHGPDTSGNGYPVLSHGLIRCPSCHLNRKHHLDWPQEAFWQWEIRGKSLWAWDRMHALKLLEQIESKQRRHTNASSLYRIPSFFLEAKVRDQLTKKMRKTLHNTTDRK